ncbi:MAG: hypothetical protein MHPSP_003321, partial [Paramarteilia canceri]
KKVWVKIPITSPQFLNDESQNISCNSEIYFQKWKILRSLLNSLSNIGVCLELDSSECSIENFEKWFLEPLKCILIDKSIFNTVGGKQALPSNIVEIILRTWKVGIVDYSKSLLT